MNKDPDVATMSWRWRKPTWFSRHGLRGVHGDFAVSETNLEERSRGQLAIHDLPNRATSLSVMVAIYKELHRLCVVAMEKR